MANVPYEPEKDCEEIKLDPCLYNVLDFAEILKKTIQETDPGQYNGLLNNCWWWANRMIREAKKKAEGCRPLYDKPSPQIGYT